MGMIGLWRAMLLMLSVQPASCYVLNPAKSQVWIEGRATLKRFSCRATQVEGHGVVEAGGAMQAQLVVAVQAFDCGEPSMNRDLQQALQADRFPAIRFVLGKVAVLEAPTVDSVRLDVTGALTIAGVTRTVRFVASGQLLVAGRVRLTGLLPLKLTDFKVKPPTALFGLVRVYDQITVHFDLVVQPVAWPLCVVTMVDSLNPP
ncbi:MAG: YceI family protein [Rhodothermus sp.]|nr:YceI family protein [Rhodothermus sp.]